MAIVDEYIERCIKAINTDGASEDRGKLVKEIVATFSEDIPSIKKGLDRYRGRIITPGETIRYKNDEDIKALLGKLRSYKERIERTATEYSQLPAITLNQTMNNVVEVHVSLAQTVELINKIDTSILSADEKIELLGLMAELEGLKNDKTKKSTALDIANRIFDKAIDKGTEVVVASLPQILSVLQTLI